MNVTEVVEQAATETLDECPLCGSISWRTLPVPGHWIGLEVFGDLKGAIGLVRCHGCGLVFTNPRPANDKLAAFYAGDTYTCHEAAGSASAGTKADFLLRRVADFLPPEAPRTLLDYGAGGGGFLNEARKHGWHVRGFEPGRRGCQTCQRAGLDVTDQLEELPAAAFGLITLHHVFEHLPNPLEVLAGIRHLLAPHGRLYIEVPNVRSLRARLAVPLLSRRFSVDERYRAYPIHLMYYSDRTLRGMLEKAGWVVEKTFTIGLGMDEFFTSSMASPRRANPASQSNGGAGGGQRRWRHRLRDAFLALGLGENLAAVAYPIR